MKKLILLILTIILVLPLIGNPIDENTAKQLAQNFWKENNIMGVRGDKVFKKRMDDARFVNVSPQCGYSEFYIFNNEGGKGFVIIAADDRVTPILGYSYDNNFTAENLPPNLKGWLDGYAEQIQAAVEMRATATDEDRIDWECLRQGKNLPIKSESAVSPLLGNNEWGQGCYYNNLCPNDPNGECHHTATGCTGTAMAQIMHYWEYPEIGTESVIYTPSGYPTQSVNFGESVYDWDNMPNELDWTTPEIQVTAVAKLLWHCGVSLHAAYGPTSTSANPTNVPNALQSFFKYSSDCYGEWKDNNTVWLNKVRQCLDNGRPIHYSAWSYQDEGHSFVCDGYNEYDFLHFNWGWNGNDNGFFSLTALNAGGYQFNSSHYAVFDIHPNISNFNLIYHSNVQMSNTDYWFYDDISAYTEILNNGNQEFNGYIGAGVFMETDNDYSFIGIMDQWDFTGNPLSEGAWIYGDFEDTGGPPYIPGSYVIIMLYSMDGYYWDFINNGSYYDGFFDINYSSSIETRSEFTILTGDGSCLFQNTDATVNVDLINAGSETFYGRFRINLANPDGSWVQNLGVIECNNGLSANYHYTNGLDFTGIITASPGTYLMELAYQESGSSSWYYAGASNYQNPVWVYVAPEPVYADPYEPNNSQNLAYSFTPNFSGNSATVNTTGSNLHDSSDLDFYKINLNSGYDYTITPRLHDAFNSGNGNTYSVDAMFAYSTDGVNWSDFYDDVMNGNFSVIDGGTIYFDVISYFEGDIGTYLLNIGITRTQHSVNNYTINVSANPTNGGSVSIAGEVSYGFENGFEGWTSIDADGDGFNWMLGSVLMTGYIINAHNGEDMVCSQSYDNDEGALTPDNYLVSPQIQLGGSITFWACAQDPEYAAEHFGVAVSTTHNTNASAFTTISEWTINAKNTGNGLGNYKTRSRNGRETTWIPYTVDLSAYNGQGYVAIRHFGCNDQFYLNVDDVTIHTIGGNTYYQGQTCTVHAIPYNGYTFVNWTENGTQVSTNANYIFTVTGNRNLVAHFQQQQQQFTISVSANPSNGGSVSGGGTFNQGASCTVHATANNGYTFVNWTENGTQVSTNANYTFTVTGNRNLVAHFQQQQQQYTISVSANPSNGGSVSGGGTFNQDATANSGYTFVNWTENGTQVSTNANYTFTVTGNRNLVAHFQQQQQQYTISVSANPSNGGSVSGGGTFNQGASCTVHATANSGYTFVNWTENGTQVSTNANYAFTVTGNRNLIAHFQQQQQQYTISVSANPSNGGSVSGGGTFNQDGTQVSTNANYSFTVTGNRNLVANFAQSEHTIQATAGANGIITPSGTVTVTHGANQSFAMIPDAGYEIQDVYIDGNSVGALTSYTFTNVTANHYIHVTFVHVDSVDDNNILSAVVYPNPTSGEVTIECEGLSHVRIVNTFGQTVYNANHEGNQAVIDLSQMAKGIYMMHIEAEGGQMVRKIVVE